MNTSAKKILQIAVLSIFFIFIVAYALGRSHDLIFGVQIRNVNLQDGATLHDAVLDVTGNAKYATRLTLDGREISVDEKGNFSEKIALLTGYNIITIKAVDKFGYSDEKNYKLIYEY